MASLFEDVSELAREQGRMPGTPGHDRARDYLLGRFSEIGLEPYRSNNYEHCFTPVAGGFTGCNLTGLVRGSVPGLPPIVLGAHYDSVLEGQCADDNTSGVAVILAVAEAMAANPLTRDLIVVAFDTEEPPHFLGEDMGSIRWVQDVLDGPVQLAIILDIVGHPIRIQGLSSDLIFVAGAETHPELPATITNLDLPILASRRERIGDYSDYYAFRKAGHPFLFFSCGEWAEYHTSQDTIDGLDFVKLGRLVTSLDTVLRRSDEAEIAEHIDHDCTEFELNTLRQQLGAERMTELAALFGEPVSTRQHLDQVVSIMRAEGQMS